MTYATQGYASIDCTDDAENGMSNNFAAVHESVVDAVDGSSTGT
jgi:hypothetical protein